MKLCRDCKWCVTERFLFWRSFRFAKCRIMTQTSLVHGGKSKANDWEYCSTGRRFDHCCGPEGKFWEAR